jgi:methenyltetrahydrofolate cyclohydrolase
VAFNTIPALAAGNSFLRVAGGLARRLSPEDVENDMHDSSAPISAFLDAAASRQPTPGGGSIAALTGALAASMGEMVLNYSVNKKDLQAHRTELESALSHLHRARELLLRLMVDDQGAYTTLTEARKLGKGDEYYAAVLLAIRVPEAIAETAVAMLEICEQLVEKVNRHLLSDLAVCCDLAMATIRCASYNIRINLPDMADQAGRAVYEDAANKIVKEGIELIQRISPRIWARVAGAT